MFELLEMTLAVALGVYLSGRLDEIVFSAKQRLSRWRARGSSSRSTTTYSA
jgi:hypothetical protein